VTAAGFAPFLPLLAPADPDRPIAWRHGRPVLLAQFAQHVRAIAQSLPAAGSMTAHMLNLCEDRYRFLAAYAAALSVGHIVLMPPSRAEQVLTEVGNTHPRSYRCDDSSVEAALNSTADVTAILGAQIPAERTVMIGFTSGSTGQPQGYPKQWRSVHGSSAHNSRAIREALGTQGAADSLPWIVATVPPQHMYGMEMSVLLPLIGGMAVHSSRPLFPADIALALDEIPEPRILVSTPLHLRTLVEAEQRFAPTALIISATAPLDSALAAAVERKLGGRLLEMFGSTETCVFASRRTASGEPWRMYEQVELRPGDDGTAVHAPWFVEPIQLQDIVELQDGGRFVVRGRNTDMIEVAGKRASLSDLTRRLLAIDGVEDAVVFQPEGASIATIRRVAALVVAPKLTSRLILDQLAASVDPAFLPRPLLIVESLPRNELGKLPRDQLLKRLQQR
jgi:acyl-coenzyme A synthetase/AMP-(fatty) acid ligase